jgi:hypothetical protein
VKTDWTITKIIYWKPNFSISSEDFDDHVYRMIAWTVNDQIFGEIQDHVWNDIDTWSEDV